MATFRKLPSGLWQASVALPVRLPSGRRRRATKTHPLKAVVREWAVALEASVAGGTWGDPRGGQVTLREWRRAWLRGRIVATSTQRKNDSHWRKHIEPRWGGHPLDSITRAAVKAWIVELVEHTCPGCGARVAVAGRGHRRPDGQPCSVRTPGLGAWTVQGVVTHLSAMLSAAVEDGLLPANPAAGLRLPRADAKPVFYWTRDEAARLLIELGGIDAVMVDFGLHTGLRLGELLGLRVRYVDCERWLVHVVGVQTRSGWREYPKTRRSRRPVPVPAHLREPLWELVALRGGEEAVFSRDGRSIDDRNFARRVFEPAVERAGIRRGTPHDMRHTAASWLVQEGVDLYRVQALLGHESFRTTQRYAHLAPDAFDEVLAAWSSARVDVRTNNAAIHKTDSTTAREQHRP